MVATSPTFGSLAGNTTTGAGGCPGVNGRAGKASRNAVMRSSRTMCLSANGAPQAPRAIGVQHENKRSLRGCLQALVRRLGSHWNFKAVGPLGDLPGHFNYLSAAVLIRKRKINSTVSILVRTRCAERFQFLESVVLEGNSISKEAHEP